MTNNETNNNHLSTNYNIISHRIDNITESDKERCIETVFKIGNLISAVRSCGMIWLESVKITGLPPLLDVGRKAVWTDNLFKFIDDYLRTLYLHGDILETLIIKEGLLAIRFRPGITDFEEAILPLFGYKNRKYFMQRREKEEVNIREYLKSIADKEPVSGKTALLEKELLNGDPIDNVNGIKDFGYDDAARAISGASGKAIECALNAYNSNKPVKAYTGVKYLIYNEIKLMAPIKKEVIEELQIELLRNIYYARKLYAGKPWR